MAKKRSSTKITNFNSLSSRQMRHRKPINDDSLKDIEALTSKQEDVFVSFDNDRHIVACGAAGTGKTFLLLYNALCDVFSDKLPYEKIYIVRSLVPTREIGFLPGGHEDKASLYEIPYKNMVKEMFDYDEEPISEMVYGNLKSQETISFWSTSFIRGTTLNNAIILVDEFQNLNFHELDSIITRVGKNSKILFCGDTAQSDLIKPNEKTGIHTFMTIIKEMESFDVIEFGVEDIVRSKFVKEYLTKKHNLNIC